MSVDDVCLRQSGGRRDTTGILAATCVWVLNLFLLFFVAHAMVTVGWLGVGAGVWGGETSDCRGDDREGDLDEQVVKGEVKGDGKEL